MGAFTLVYTDDSSDDFISIKSTFTYSGYFCPVEGVDQDPFGIKILVNTKGNVIPDVDDDDLEEQEKINVKRSESLVGRRGTTAASKLIDDEKLEKTFDSSNQSRTSSKMQDQKKLVTKFITQKLVCKLCEGTVTTTWTIVPGDMPDCSEAGTKSDAVSWPWSGSSTKESHVAPRGALDFLGEEDLESGAIDLKIRIPQLAAAWTPPVVVLTEVGGWKLDKAWR